MKHYCTSCQADLTDADEEARECTQCGAEIDTYRCPWCWKWQTTDEIRRCSGYQSRLSKADVLDAYSDNPSKRERMERDYE